MQINKQEKTTKKRMIIPLAVFVALVGGLVAYAYLQKTWPFTDTKNQHSSETGDTINYNPPTDQEMKDSQDGKKASNQDNQTGKDDKPKNSGQKKAVAVGISYADIFENKLEIRAFTNSIIEGTGTCTATVTMKNMPNMKITKTSEAFVDASSSQCRPIYIPVSELHSGAWEVSVKFSSPDREGTSEVVKVNVP